VARVADPAIDKVPGRNWDALPESKPMVGEQLLSSVCELHAATVAIEELNKREANPACKEPLAPPKNRQVSPAGNVRGGVYWRRHPMSNE
jgi:hypothetical protein